MKNKTKAKAIFDVFEEVIFVPMLIMVFLVSALAYSTNSDKSHLSGQIDQLYCRHDGISGKQIYATGSATNPDHGIGKIRLRFIKDGRSVNNSYLANPANFTDKNIASYTTNGTITLQAFDQQTGEFITLDEKSISCSDNGLSKFSQGRSAISISKNEIKTDGRDFAVLEIKLIDQFGEPIVNEPVIVNITDYFFDDSTRTQDIKGYYTNHHGIIELQVVYDIYDQKTTKAEIGFSVGNEKFKGGVEVNYLHSSDNVGGSIDKVECNFDAGYRPIININGHASDPDNLSAPVKATFYLTDENNRQKFALGNAYTDTNHKFGISINRSIFDFGHAIDVYLTDLNSGIENYLGQIDSECEISN